MAKKKGNLFLRLLHYLLIGGFSGSVPGAIIAFLLFINLTNQLGLYILIGAAAGAILGMACASTAWLARVLTEPEEYIPIESNSPLIDSALKDSLEKPLPPASIPGQLKEVNAEEGAELKAKDAFLADLYKNPKPYRQMEEPFNKRDINFLSPAHKAILITKRFEINQRLDECAAKTDLHIKWIYYYSTSNLEEGLCKLPKFARLDLLNLVPSVETKIKEYNQLIDQANHLLSLQAALAEKEKAIQSKKAEIDNLLKENLFIKQTTRFFNIWNNNKEDITSSNLSLKIERLNEIVNGAATVFGLNENQEIKRRRLVAQALAQRVKEYTKLLEAQVKEIENLREQVDTATHVFNVLANSLTDYADPLIDISKHLPKAIEQALIAKRNVINQELDSRARGSELRYAWAEYYCIPFANNDATSLDSFKPSIPDLPSSITHYNQLIECVKPLIGAEQTYAAKHQQRQGLQTEIDEFVKINNKKFGPTNVAYYWGQLTNAIELNLFSCDEAMKTNFLNALEKLPNIFIDAADRQEKEGMAKLLKGKFGLFITLLNDECAAKEESRNLEQQFKELLENQLEQQHTSVFRMV